MYFILIALVFSAHSINRIFCPSYRHGILVIISDTDTSPYLSALPRYEDQPRRRIKSISGPADYFCFRKITDIYRYKIKKVIGVQVVAFDGYFFASPDP